MELNIELKMDLNIEHQLEVFRRILTAMIFIPEEYRSENYYKYRKEVLIEIKRCIDKIGFEGKGGYNG